MDQDFNNNNIEQPVQDGAPMAPPEPPMQPMNDIQPMTPPVEPAPVADQPLFPSSAPAAPEAPVAPAPEGSEGIAFNMPTDDKKPKKGLLIGIIAGAGALVITGVILLIVFLGGGGGGTIGSLEEFKDAVKNLKAINCDLTLSGMEGMSAMLNDATITYQADDGWNNIHISAPALLGMQMWAVKEGDSYTVYSSAMGMNVKQTQTVKEFMSGQDGMMGGDFEEFADKAKLDCKPNKDADFTLPAGVEFKESSSLIDDDDDYDWDWDDDDDDYDYDYDYDYDFDWDWDE